MTTTLFGAILACCSSVFWTISPLAFAAAGRRIGSFYVNVLRLAMASVLLFAIVAVHSIVIRHSLLLLPAAGALWLTLSGVVVIALGR